jgi:hypothetical protein
VDHLKPTTRTGGFGHTDEMKKPGN